MATSRYLLSLGFLDYVGNSEIVACTLSYYAAEALQPSALHCYCNVCCLNSYLNPSWCVFLHSYTNLITKFMTKWEILLCPTLKWEVHLFSSFLSNVSHLWLFKSESIMSIRLSKIFSTLLFSWKCCGSYLYLGLSIFYRLSFQKCVSHYFGVFLIDFA